MPCCCDFYSVLVSGPFTNGMNFHCDYFQFGFVGLMGQLNWQSTSYDIGGQQPAQSNIKVQNFIFQQVICWVFFSCALSNGFLVSSHQREGCLTPNKCNIDSKYFKDWLQIKVTLTRKCGLAPNWLMSSLLQLPGVECK